MYYSHEVVQEVVALNDVLEVISDYVPSLKPRAGSHFGLCPFHNEKTPSFSVSQDRQIFNCFGCGEKGSVLTFIMRFENMDFVDALKLLADRVRYTLPEKGSNPNAKQNAAKRERYAEINKRAAMFFHEYLNSDNADSIRAREYLEGRGVEPRLMKRFGLGLSEDAWDSLIVHLKDVAVADISAAGLASQSQKNAERYYDRFRARLMFPIIDVRGKVVGFGGRIMKEEESSDGKKEAKYVNTPETILFKKSDHLYGLNLARKARSHELIIVEGYMDVLALHQAGFINTAGVLGTALNDAHVKQLTRASCTSVVLVLDSDDAGVKAALRAIPVLLGGNIKVRVLNLHNAKDPDEFIQKFGQAAFHEAVSTARSHIAFRVNLLDKKFDLGNIDERVEYTQEAAKILAELKSDIELDVYLNEIADASGISANAIFAEVKKHRGEKDQNINMPRNPRVLMQVKSDERGVKDARKGLLNLIFSHQNAALALDKSGVITPSDMTDEVYSKILELIFDSARTNKNMSPSDIINYFETPESQQTATEIFITGDKYPSIEKALNDMAIVVKRAWINEQKAEILQNNDLNALKTLQLLEKNITTQYITMSDG